MSRTIAVLALAVVVFQVGGAGAVETPLPPVVAQCLPNKLQVVHLPAALEFPTQIKAIASDVERISVVPARKTDKGYLQASSTDASQSALLVIPKGNEAFDAGFDVFLSDQRTCAFVLRGNER